MAKQINIKNKKAFFEYLLFDKYVAGIALSGTEIKSIRDGKANLSDSYCTFKGNELWVKNLHISAYEKATSTNHEPKRTRKLLLNKRELKKIYGKIEERGFTIVPIRLFISERSYAKLEIAVAKGKKMHDKRQALKEKDILKEMDRGMRRR